MSLLNSNVICENHSFSSKETQRKPSSACLFAVSSPNLINLNCPYILKRFTQNPLPGTLSRFEAEVVALKISSMGRCAAFILKHIGLSLPMASISPSTSQAISKNNINKNQNNCINISCCVSVFTSSTHNAVIKKRKYVYKNHLNTIEKEINLDSEIYLDAEGVLWETIGKFLIMKIECESSEKEISFKSSRYYLNIRSLKLPIPRFLSLGQIVVRHTGVSAQNFNLSISLSHPLLGTLFEQTSVFKEM